MDYKEIKLNVSNDKIKEYKQFEGLKIYSDIFKFEDEKVLIGQTKEIIIQHLIQRMIVNTTLYLKFHQN